MNDDVTPWISASDANGTCIELRRVGLKNKMRDSKDPEGKVLDTFTQPELAAFLRGAREGKFDHLV
jgi:hypothetical protein